MSFPAVADRVVAHVAEGLDCGRDNCVAAVEMLIELDGDGANVPDEVLAHAHRRLTKLMLAEKSAGAHDDVVATDRGELAGALMALRLARPNLF